MKHNFFRYVPEETAIYLKNKNYKIMSEISPIWNKCGCTNPKINKDFPYLMQLLNNQQNYTYREWVNIANENISNVVMYECRDILKKALKENNIELDNQTINEIIYIRVIWETWFGYCCEHDTYEFIKNELMNVQQIQSLPGWADAKYGVDLVVTTKDNRKIALQVKPTSFLLLSNNKKDFANTKIQQYCNDYGGSYMFVYTDHGMISDLSKQQLRREIDNGEVRHCEILDNLNVVIM